MQKNAIAFGTFDGIHLGHKAVLENILKSGFTPLVLTFDFPPKMSGKSNLILTSDEKKSRLSDMGIEPVFLDFEAVKDSSPEKFLNYVNKEYSPALISTGFNFRFGKGAKGDTGTLNDFCNNHGIKYEMAKPIKIENSIVSSTNIRKLISNGSIRKANRMLGWEFSFKGKIVHGDRRGRTIGFPTINLIYPSELVCPKYGVYSSRTEIGSESYRSVTNIGIRPTFKIDYVISETYIFDFNGDIYGENARVSLCDFIRSEMKFDSLDELRNAISKDKEKVISSLE